MDSSSNQRNLKSAELMKNPIVVTTSSDVPFAMLCLLQYPKNASINDYVKRLRNLGDKSGSEILLTLLLSVESFEVLMKEHNVSFETTCLVLSILAKVCECPTDNQRVLLNRLFIQILPQTTNEHHFLTVELLLFVAQMDRCIAATSDKRDACINATHNLLVLLQTLQSALPTASLNVVKPIIPLLKLKIDFFNNKEGDCFKRADVDVLNGIERILTDKLDRNDHTAAGEPVQQPPNDFRSIEIRPIAEEMFSREGPFLRPNIVDGKYIGGVEHYLDVQFRLLREDFVGPLREGIFIFKDLMNSGVDDPTMIDTIGAVRIYHSVQIENPVLGAHGKTIFKASFNTSNLGNIDWMRSKRLLTGSLVYLTIDDFSTFVVATVAGVRDPTNLEQGLFELEVEEFNNSSIALYEEVPHLTMMESISLFESYRHNLQVMQTFGVDNFPMAKYIVNVENVVDPPPYLKVGALYDLQCLTCPLIQRPPEIRMEENVQFSIAKYVDAYPQPEVANQTRSINIQDDSQWPDQNVFGLDESQYAALKAALTKQLAIIQGPPGTGKTYLGLRILQAILNNTKDEEFPPVLVVCYTNHALDQFLEGMLPFCQEIVRIGGNSKSTILNQFNINELTKSDTSQSSKKWKDISVSFKKKIIGMTTTGAAKYRHIIEGTKPKVVIVEEAGEVLEAHILTSLSKETEHLILIGDHQQLKPNPAVFNLAKKFKLDISMFERFIKNGLPNHPLTQQHRMRPEISSLLAPRFYRTLRDHPSVYEYEHIKGVASDMFFLNHNHEEGTYADTKSRINDFEAEFVVRLCKYLIQQGYDSSQITILSMYSGQKHRIMNLMKEHDLLTGVRATVVDNFQGEESDIIIISFVRSNDDGNIGFLQTSNRVNVALSRAKKGLFCIGNFDCLAKNSVLWESLTTELKSKNAIGDCLKIYCQKHPMVGIDVKSGSDFDGTPDGGCNQPCNTRLICGHCCDKLCHSYDPEHEEIGCAKTCNQFTCENEHRCLKTCHVGEGCGSCSTMVLKTLPCTHEIEVECGIPTMWAKCTAKCEKSYTSCSHKCNQKCGEDCDPKKCKALVGVVGACGHDITVECALSQLEDKVLQFCKEQCGEVLECSHTCTGTCSDCNQGRLHIPCMEQCGEVLECSHTCTGTCSDCNQGRLHIPCMEQCGEVLECSHTCTGTCSDCNQGRLHIPCMETTLVCGHKCGEQCLAHCEIVNQVFPQRRKKRIHEHMEDQQLARAAPFLIPIDRTASKRAQGYQVKMNDAILWCFVTNNDHYVLGITDGNFDRIRALVRAHRALFQDRKANILHKHVALAALRCLPPLQRAEWYQNNHGACPWYVPIKHR